LASVNLSELQAYSEVVCYSVTVLSVL